MAITNHERVTRAMGWLQDGLAPFVEREIHSAVDTGGKLYSLEKLIADPNYKDRKITDWDAAALLRAMSETWNEVFSTTLGKTERNLVFELRDHRNKWAHQEKFTSDDVYRMLDSTERLLTAVAAPESDEVKQMKQELLRLRYDEQARSERRRSAGTTIDSAADTNLKPWREVITPHEDVASGRYQQAEFAADLWQVHQGEGGTEYRDPIEFFRRTFLTDSLKKLLVSGIRRLSGAGGDPVVQLQTNFGGGKTHSMLALYHLFGPANAQDLPNVDALLAESGADEVPKAKRVVLVGTKISPGNPSVKADGLVVKTLWGELAYQLGGKKAYDQVKNDDKNATNPGDTLKRLFDEYGPCLILIDEWVAYARQLKEESVLPAGSFDTQFSFAQALTESARTSKNCLLVVSLPASDTATASPAAADDVEVGGIRGRQALDRLRNVIGRVESSWRPASAEEGFEIVRRRLFQPLTDNEAFKARDVVARAYADLYRSQAQEFPPEAKEATYEQRIKNAYPIHPEVFDRLYGDWSTLVKFQRTRGVLRLMASVIHSLWDKGDRNPLIQPGNIPIDDSRVQFELTRYLSDNWEPIISRDVDGASSTPVRIDSDVPNLGKYHATRRVARTIYLGSAPSTATAHRGLEDRRVKLGCVMPGETAAVFGDALRRLAASATYLYQDGARVWYSTQPTVTKLAEDRAEQLSREPDAVTNEIERQLRQSLKQSGDFAGVHALPRSSSEVPDDPSARLVVLAQDAPYSKDAGNAAVSAAREILKHRGTAPRIYQNALTFLAADKTRLQDLEEATREYLAWQSIVDEKIGLNLDPLQVRQAETRLASAESTVTGRIPETYCWAITPEQPDPRSETEWTAMRLTAHDPLAVRVSNKLRKEELLIPVLGATILRKHMDDVPLWRGEHVQVRQLVDDFARYVYLPRLSRPDVLLHAIYQGTGLLTWDVESFAYAESFDENRERYAGLRAGHSVTVNAESSSLLVKPDVAKKQLDAESTTQSTEQSEEPDEPSATGDDIAVNGRAPGAPTEVATPDDGPTTSPRPAYRRYHGTVKLNPDRMGRDAGNIAEEVVSHLTGIVGSTVRVTLEIEAHFEDDVPEGVVRIVNENGTTLRFEAQGFEED